MKRQTIILLGLLVALMALIKRLGPPESLDALLFYTGDEARSLLDRLGPHLLAKYKISALIDLLLIAIYSHLAARGLGKFFGRHRHFLGYLPGFFDTVETLSVFSILNFGDQFSVLNWLGFVTLLKWSTGFVIMGLLVVGRLKAR